MGLWPIKVKPTWNPHSAPFSIEPKASLLSFQQMAPTFFGKVILLLLLLL
ncbi:hypothetical protein IC575_005119 [Cucumis melo]